jgi:hypothetical protein
MSYDLRRLRLHGLIQRLPRSNTYQLTSDGIRVAMFYTKLQNRLLRQLLDANTPPAPIEIRRALTTLEHAVAESSTPPGSHPQNRTCHDRTTSRDQLELVWDRATTGFQPRSCDEEDERQLLRRVRR